MIKLFGNNSILSEIKKKTNVLINKVNELETTVNNAVEAPYIPRVESGKINLGTLRAGCTMTTTVTFSQPFHEIPTILVSGTGTYYQPINTTVTITSKSRAGFTVTMASPVSSSYTASALTLRWNAEA